MSSRPSVMLPGGRVHPIDTNSIRVILEAETISSSRPTLIWAVFPKIPWTPRNVSLYPPKFEGAKMRAISYTKIIVI